MKLVSLRISHELDQRLEAIACKMDRSKSYIVRRSIINFLEELEDAQEAISILNDPTTEWIDYGEAKSKLNFG